MWMLIGLALVVCMALGSYIARSKKRHREEGQLFGLLLGPLGLLILVLMPPGTGDEPGPRLVRRLANWWGVEPRIAVPLTLIVVVMGLAACAAVQRFAF